MQEFARSHFDLFLPYGREVQAGLDFPRIMPLLEQAEFSLIPLGARSGGELYPPGIKLH